jgi:hypothetical protein
VRPQTRWRKAIMSVVLEEMPHLALVGNLANALGGSLTATRPPFPVDSGPYPAGFVIPPAAVQRGDAVGELPACRNLLCTLKATGLL